MRCWGISDTGLVREENQDAYAVKTVGQYTVAVVCDGMGGTNGGQIASDLAVRTYQDQVEQRLCDGMSAQQIAQISSFCVAQSNETIRQEAVTHPGCERMGTTLVSAIARDDLALITNIGDSRAYLITNSGIERISKDHSVVEDMIDRGELTEESARYHPKRNLITRALGPERQASADTFPVTWKQGDYLLLCSDGLVNTASDMEILFEVIHNGEAADCLNRLLELALQRGAPDNVTAILLMNI